MKRVSKSDGMNEIFQNEDKMLNFIKEAIGKSEQDNEINSECFFFKIVSVNNEADFTIMV